MADQFLSPEGDLEKYFITESWLIDQYVGSQMWVWGAGGSGASSGVGLLATNDAIFRSTPTTTFAGGNNWVQVSTGVFGRNGAIKQDGTLWVWGSVSGTNDFTPRCTPVTTFAGGNDWRLVSSGSEHMAAIKTDGTLWTWGSDLNSALGTNGAGDACTPVTTFAGGNDWKFLVCGYRSTFAIKTDGTLWGWGNNDNSKLGINGTGDRCTPVTTFAGGNNWKFVSTASDQNTGRGTHAMAIKTDGTLWVWGLNTNGQLGINNAIQRCTPVTTFAGGNNWKTVGARGRSSSAIKEDGTLWTWGGNSDGQLGVNDTLTRSTPVTTFAGGTNWKSLAGGGGTLAAAIKTDGTLWVWGFNGNGGGSRGVLGVNDILARSTPVTTFAGGNNWKYASLHLSAFAIQTGTDPRFFLP